MDKAKVKLAIAPIAWTNDDLPELGAEIEALENSTKQRVSTLIDIKVLPKTMTHGYNSFWNTCAIEVSHNQEIASYGKQVKANREASFKY